MLSGVADPAARESEAPTLSDLDTEPISLEGASVLQVLCEVANDNAELLPPALHPTVPGIVNWGVYDFPDSPWGAFRMAQTRIECRSGTRPRGFLISGVIDNAAAREALEARWGYQLTAGEIELRRGYDGVEVAVRSQSGEPMLSLGLRAPVRLPPEVVQFVASIHPARTPRGYRLLQVDLRHGLERAERGEPLVEWFDAAAWGEARIAPVYPVSACICLGAVVLPRLRFLCKPDQIAFTGTEVIAVE